MREEERKISSSMVGRAEEVCEVKVVWCPTVALIGRRLQEVRKS